MNAAPAQITLDEWDRRYRELAGAGLRQPSYGGPLRRHVEQGGDLRLLRLRFDNSAAALRLWNFLLSESDRLFAARQAGTKIIGTMKDLGTVPVIAYALPRTIAFYPDGAWWVPCLMETSTEDLNIADAHGLDESFCPVRAMLGAFVTCQHFPEPHLLVCSVGAVCDDFSAIAQRLEALGFPILWWEMPARRRAQGGEASVRLGELFEAPASQVAFVRGELQRIAAALEETTGHSLSDARLAESIRLANRVRRLLAELRHRVFTAPRCPLPALELLIAEMLAIHYCSDREQVVEVLEELLAEVRRRVDAGLGLLDPGAPRIFWVNPVADIQVMNLLEECGGRLCGSEFLFCHALDPIQEDVPPMEALARAALADPMVGPAADRARRIVHDARLFGAEAVLISRIPGASHCASEGGVMREIIQAELDLPVVEIEVPPLSDAIRPALRTRLEALLETVRHRRGLA
jgi:hypothetical protein